MMWDTEVLTLDGAVIVIYTSQAVVYGPLNSNWKYLQSPKTHFAKPDKYNCPRSTSFPNFWQLLSSTTGKKTTFFVD